MHSIKSRTLFKSKARVLSALNGVFSGLKGSIFFAAQGGEVVAGRETWRVD
jgi:hypothetical protein